MTPDFNQLHGVWNGRVKGSQPLHQLIPMAARSSTRHRLIWLSPQLVEVVLQNLLSILGHPLADAVFSAASFPAVRLPENTAGNIIMLMHIGQEYH
jgi:hypothetical protein